MFSFHYVRRMWHSLITLLFSVTLLYALLLPTVNAKMLRESIYDAQIIKWSNWYTPDIPWYYTKAQLIVESGLNTNAVSPVGAMGLGQFMPNTWKDMQRQLGWNSSVSAYASSYNIQATSYYMKYLRGQFKLPRPEYDKHSLALASYNAGLGNILKAQKLGGGSLLYTPMIEALPQVTGEHSKETTTYVIRIWNYIDSYERNYK